MGGRATRAWSPGPRRRSRRHSPSTACRASTTSISRAPTCSSASTRRSGDAPTWCGSSPMPPHAAGWCGPWRSRRTRTGSRPTATSTWTTSRSTRKPLSRSRLASLIGRPALQNLTHTIQSRLRHSGAIWTGRSVRRHHRGHLRFRDAGPTSTKLPTHRSAQASRELICRKFIYCAARASSRQPA